METFFNICRPDETYCGIIPLKIGTVIISIIFVIVGCFLIFFALAMGEDYFISSYDSTPMGIWFNIYVLIFGVAITLIHIVLLGAAIVESGQFIKWYLAAGTGIVCIDALIHFVFAIMLCIRGMVIGGLYEIYNCAFVWLLVFFVVFNAVNGYRQLLMYGIFEFPEQPRPQRRRPRRPRPQPAETEETEEAEEAEETEETEPPESKQG